MPIKLTVTFMISLLILGASYAFADGLLNSAPETRAHGGVGNYLFRSDRGPRASRNELVNNETAYEEESARYEADALTVRQSSAVEPMRTVTFPEFSARITSTESRRLDEIAAELKADTELRAVVTGYADKEGSRTKIRALSLARANNVARELKERGVSDSQLTVESKGESNPLSASMSPEGRAQNRRVEIHYR